MTDQLLTEPELLAIYAQLTTHPNPTPTTPRLAARILTHIDTLPTSINPEQETQ